MRKIQTMLLAMGLIGGATMIVGCEKTASTDKATREAKREAEDTKTDAKRTAEDLKTDAKRTAEDLKASADDAARAEKAVRESVVKPINEGLVMADDKIKAMTTEEGKLTGDTKKVISDKIVKAKELLAKVKDAVKAYSEAAGDKATAAKDTMLKLFGELKTAVGL